MNRGDERYCVMPSTLALIMAHPRASDRIISFLLHLDSQKTVSSCTDWKTQFCAHVFKIALQAANDLFSLRSIHCRCDSCLQCAVLRLPVLTCCNFT